MTGGNRAQPLGFRDDQIHCQRVLVGNRAEQDRFGTVPVFGFGAEVIRNPGTNLDGRIILEELRDAVEQVPRGPANLRDGVVIVRVDAAEHLFHLIFGPGGFLLGLGEESLHDRLDEIGVHLDRGKVIRDFVELRDALEQDRQIPIGFVAAFRDARRVLDGAKGGFAENRFVPRHLERVPAHNPVIVVEIREAHRAVTGVDDGHVGDRNVIGSGDANRRLVPEMHGGPILGTGHSRGDHLGLREEFHDHLDPDQVFRGVHEGVFGTDHTERIVGARAADRVDMVRVGAEGIGAFRAGDRVDHRQRADFEARLAQTRQVQHFVVVADGGAQTLERAPDVGEGKLTVHCVNPF